ncbi:helix-turn-helix domain protein [Pseudofrankia inefficax]|uniref:Helix-turn-helix domain protein n=1 Tax=Pseudofrankia inefficax (strain DSM 45817 / CECT 9037 / DDB 130130 / EuI1c) TaxID=298654 RepID=E3J3M1_PSEI1|nr:helix-turn-helix transcriptional regulator [Pseudofrankia inefficax]ADP79358.1 helix-turn-helix domain protein [Pseudofrankia inefficax]
MTIGERIAFYRRRRGLTQAVLAGLVGRSEDWLSKVERGEREIRRVDLLAEVAKALRVTLGDLLGQPILSEEAFQGDDVPAVRDALMSPRRLSRVLFSAPEDPPIIDLQPVVRAVEAGWADYQRGRIGRVVAALPGLIGTAQHLEDAAPGAGLDYEHGAWAASARTHHLASTTLSKLGEADLSWIAAERAMQAADHSDDPLVLASAARAGTHALLELGRFEDAVNLGKTASAWLRVQLDQGDPAALSLYGMLHLRTAVAAARKQDRSTATELLGVAARAAEQLGYDGNHWQTGFGPTNVELHRLSAALDLGDVTTVVEQGQVVQAESMPVERRVSHRIDVARALHMMARDDDALTTLLDAEREAPSLVRHHPAVRETVKTMARRAPVTGGRSSALLALAARCRAV